MVGEFLRFSLRCVFFFFFLSFNRFFCLCRYNFVASTVEVCDTGNITAKNFKRTFMGKMEGTGFVLLRLRQLFLLMRRLGTLFDIVSVFFAECSRQLIQQWDSYKNLLGHIWFDCARGYIYYIYIFCMFKPPFCVCVVCCFLTPRLLSRLSANPTPLHTF